jgi:hypothetical protein
MIKLKYSYNTKNLLSNNLHYKDTTCNSVLCNENTATEKAVISFSKYSSNEVFTDFYCSCCLEKRIKENFFGNNYIIVDIKNFDHDKIIKQLNQMAIML